LSKLSHFIVTAKKKTYAESAGEGAESLTDGSKQFVISIGEHSYRDRYFGTDPFVGEEIVFQNSSAVWSMNYYGKTLVENPDSDMIYGFLVKALSEVTVEKPFRGPVKFVLDDWVYLMTVKGVLEEFSGKEEIYFQGELVYRLLFHGGLID
jgi:hypothetical protein